MSLSKYIIYSKYRSIIFYPEMPFNTDLSLSFHRIYITHYFLSQKAFNLHVRSIHIFQEMIKHTDLSLSIKKPSIASALYCTKNMTCCEDFLIAFRWLCSVHGQLACRTGSMGVLYTWVYCIHIQILSVNHV